MYPKSQSLLALLQPSSPGTANIDLFLVLSDDVWYSIPITAEEQKCVVLRVEPSKNNQQKGVNLAENYILNW